MPLMAYNKTRDFKESIGWIEKTGQVFGDEPVVKPEDPEVVESSAMKVGPNMDLLSIYIWPKLMDKLLTICKKWGKEISIIFNFPRP